MPHKITQWLKAFSAFWLLFLERIPKNKNNFAGKEICVLNYNDKHVPCATDKKIQDTLSHFA